MNRTAMIIGAIGLAASIGVAAGSTVPTEPIGLAGDPLAEIPQHEPSQVAYQPHRNTGPNHYAMETPEGRIEVHELSDYGLYRNRRYAAADYYDGYDMEQGWLEAEYEPAEIERSALPVEIIGPSPSGKAPIAAARAGAEVMTVETGSDALEAEPAGLPVLTASAKAAPLGEDASA